MINSFEREFLVFPRLTIHPRPRQFATNVAAGFHKLLLRRRERAGKIALHIEFRSQLFLHENGHNDSQISPTTIPPDVADLFETSCTTTTLPLVAAIACDQCQVECAH